MARSDKDPVPEFENPADALAWMEAKLNGSWVDAITEEQLRPKLDRATQRPDAAASRLSTPVDPPATAINGPVDSDGKYAGSHGSTSSTGYNPEMSAAEITEMLEKMWKTDGESS